MMNESDDLRKLKDWLADYALYRQMDLPEDALSGRDEGDYDFSAEPAPAAGQIRLWPSGEIAEAPMYGLVLPGGYGEWRVVPFSPLAFPAVPEELRWFDEPPAQVLEGWNRRFLPTAAVARSWRVDTLDDAACFRLQGWLLSLDAEGEIPPDLKPKTGPPIHHPLDPRHDYLDMESARADLCLGEETAGYRAETPGPLSLAAEGGAAYARRSWRVDGPDGGRVEADPDGIRIESPPPEWNGAEIVGDNGVRLQWTGARIRFPGANRVEWRRIETSGGVLDLREEL